MSFKTILCAIVAIIYCVCSVQADVRTTEKTLSGDFWIEKRVPLNCNPDPGEQFCDIREVSISGGYGVLEKVQLRYEGTWDTITVDCRRKGSRNYVCDGKIIIPDDACLDVVLTPDVRFGDVKVSVKSVHNYMEFAGDNYPSCGGPVNVNEITREKTLGGPFKDEIIVSLNCNSDIGYGEDCDLREVSTSGGYGVLYNVELRYEQYGTTEIVDCWKNGDTNFVCNGQWTFEEDGFVSPNPRVVLTPDLGLGNGPVGNVKVSVKSIDGTMNFG